MVDIPARLLPEDSGQDSTWSSASKLSRKVRELAHRAHRAIRRPSRQEPRPDDVADDLRDLCQQVARLQRKIHERKLSSLIPWVDSLRQTVEDRLGDDRAGGHHEIA
jgi:hypothetical protein